MHRLQQHILQQLILNPSLRYSQIKPQEVEGNLFMYHLKQLMKDGIAVKKTDGTYQLSAKGKLYADQLSLQSFTRRVQPRIITLMAVENGQGEWLFYRRKKQPLINMIGFPYGKIHLGESIKIAASRELFEKTGLEADLEHRGDGYATTFENGEPVSEVFFHMFYGCKPRGILAKQSNIGDAFWASPDVIDGAEYMPNVVSLLQLVQQSHPDRRFFAELNHDL